MGEQFLKKHCSVSSSRCQSLSGREMHAVFQEYKHLFNPFREAMRDIEVGSLDVARASFR